MSQQGPTAADLVNTLDREELTRILRDYGEEPYAWQIAGKIVAARGRCSARPDKAAAVRGYVKIPCVIVLFC